MEEKMTALQKLINTAVEFLVNYSFDVLGAILVLIAGAIVANWIASLVMKALQKNKADITLSKFITTTIRMIAIAFAVLIALGKFGITIAPFIAALSALALGASFAIQPPLSNYGAGLSIILSRPFIVGDTITVAGVSGVVKDVKLAATILTNEDGTHITIPNKEIVGQILHNSKANKVVESVIGISYSNNPDAAIAIIRLILQSFKEVVANPEPQIGIQDFGDSAITISYRYWVPTVKFFNISYAVNLAIFRAFEKEGISIPFPQREVRVLAGAGNIASNSARN